MRWEGGGKGCEDGGGDGGDEGDEDGGGDGDGEGDEDGGGGRRWGRSEVRI